MAFRLESYLRRVGLDAPVPATAEGLATLHQAHVHAIPFENLRIQRGLGVSLDLEILQDRILGGGQGGYCFEQNTLLREALRACGFHPVMREARVRAGAASLLARTHGLLTLQLEGLEWLADAGFGGEGPLRPVAMDSSIQAQGDTTYRVIPEGELKVLQIQGGEGWRDLYALEPREVHPIDWEMASHYTSTHPDSRFVATLTVQRRGPEGRDVLRGLTWTSWRGGVVTVRELESAMELRQVLETVFGLRVG